MKKRYLRPEIQSLLTYLTCFLISMLLMVNDFTFNLATIIFFGGWIGTIALNIYIINKWGR